MKMKRIIALVISAVMVLSMVPATLFTASAVDAEGEWTTYRRPAAYDEDVDAYQPAPGYEYTDEGFTTIPANYENSTPYFNVQTTSTHNVKEGISMTFRVDEYSYAGDLGNADQWIAISIWDTQNVNPGGTDHGSGWLCLIRGAGAGSATVQSFDTLAENEEEGITGMFAAGYTGDVAVTCEMDDEGREFYTFAVTYDETAGYSIQVNGVTISGVTTVSDHLKSLSESGDFYIGISMHSAVSNGVAGLTITEFNGAVPTGSDSKQPEENPNYIVPPMDPDGVAENRPAMIFDARKQTFKRDPDVADFKLEAQGDNSYHATVSIPAPYFAWGISGGWNYDAEDFPVVSFLLKDFQAGPSGRIWYCAGEVMSPQNDCTYQWFVDPTANSEQVTVTRADATGAAAEDGEYLLVCMDLSYMWAGRINNIRFSLDGVDVAANGTEKNEFDICYMGVFRDTDEATVYFNDYMSGALAEETLPPEETMAPDETGDPAETGETGDPAETGNSEPETLAPEQLASVSKIDKFVKKNATNLLGAPTGLNQTDVTWNDDYTMTLTGTWKTDDIVVDAYFTIKYASLMSKAYVNFKDEYGTDMKSLPNKNGEFGAIVYTVSSDKIDVLKNNFELWYSVGTAGSTVSGGYSTYEIADGDLYYVIFDLSDYNDFTSDFINQIRLDWYNGTATEENVGLSMTVHEVALYKTVEDFLAEKEVTLPATTTKAPSTSAQKPVATEPTTTAGGTGVATTAAGGDDGCGSVVGTTAIALVAMAGVAAVVVSKKKNDEE